MTQYLLSHFKLPLDATRYSLRRVEFEKSSRLGSMPPNPPREVHIAPKMTLPLLKVWLRTCTVYTEHTSTSVDIQSQLFIGLCS